MAKKVKASYELRFTGIDLKFERAKFVELDPIVGVNRFMYIEYLNDSVRIMKTKDFLFNLDDLVEAGGFVFQRNDDPEKPNHIAIRDGREIPVTKYAILDISAEQKIRPGYYIDELEDGSIRIVHGKDFLDYKPHNQINSIELWKSVNAN